MSELLSPIQLLAGHAIRILGRDRAREVLEQAIASMSVTQLAAIRYDWENVWARPKQRLPEGPWRSLGFLTGRRFGKTRANSEFVVREAMAGRAKRIGLCAQTEDDTVGIMIESEAGIVACSPPWFKAKYWPGNKEVVFPNGAVCDVFTPQEPKNIRGYGHQLFIASELAYWPASTAQEAMSNIELSTSEGYGKVVWDTTPKRRNALVRNLLARSIKFPGTHLLVCGTTSENERNLAPGVVEQWLREYGGTQKGREELGGEYLDEHEGAMFQQAWIEAARRHMPAEFKRRIVSVDPAISTRKANDQTGIVELGLADGQIYVIANRTGKYAPHEWSKIVLDAYFRNGCDCVVVERNRGGDLVTATLRAAAATRGAKVELLDPKAHVGPPPPGVVQVKEVHATRSKDIRAEPVATHYERGAVSHVIGADLAELEDVMVTWEPSGEKSPDAMDALVHGVYELAGEPGVDPKTAFRGMTKAAQALAPAARPEVSGLLGALPRSQWGSRL